MTHRPGQAPIGQPGQQAAAPPRPVRGGLWVGSRYLPPIAGGETPPPPTPPQPTPPAPEPPAPEPPTPDGDEHDPVRARALIEKLRNEIRELKPQAQAGKTAQQRLQELEDAQKTDLERAQARATALEAQLATAQAAHREALIRTAIEREAHAQGAVKADVVYRLVNRDAVQVTDAGEVAGADKAVKALLDAEPYLKATTEARPGVPATPRANGNPAADKITENRQKLQATGAYARF